MLRDEDRLGRLICTLVQVQKAAETAARRHPLVPILGEVHAPVKIFILFVSMHQYVFS